MEKVVGRPNSLTEQEFHYCPGCTHGIAHRLVAEVIDELEIQEQTIGIAPVGCAVFAYDYFDLDMYEAAHGRPPAVATGIKRVHPDKVVFTYQGDGDFVSIGMAESVHAASRGEKFTTVFINNAIYGMTGGQMAPTTLEGQRATTAPDGRNVEEAGYPIRMSELIATLEGAVYVARVAVDSPQHIKQAKKAIKKAFKVQLAGLGYSLVEVLSTCPTNWGLSPQEAIEWLQERMIPYYPLGELKSVEEVE